MGHLWGAFAAVFIGQRTAEGGEGKAEGGDTASQGGGSEEEGGGEGAEGEGAEGEAGEGREGEGGEAAAQGGAAQGAAGGSGVSAGPELPAVVWFLLSPLQEPDCRGAVGFWPLFFLWDCRLCLAVVPGLLEVLVVDTLVLSEFRPQFSNWAVASVDNHCVL